MRKTLARQLPSLIFVKYDTNIDEQIRRARSQAQTVWRWGGNGLKLGVGGVGTKRVATDSIVDSTWNQVQAGGVGTTRVLGGGGLA